MTDRIKKIEALIGKPYSLGANGPDAFDCYGLAQYVQRDVYGVHMTGDRPKSLDVASTIETIVSHPERQKWQPVTWPSDGDLVVMANVMDQQRHLGTYIVVQGASGVLHVTDKAVVFEDRNTILHRGFSDMTFFRRRADHK